MISSSSTSSSTSTLGLLAKIGPEWTVAWATVALVLVTVLLGYLQQRSSKKQSAIDALMKNRDRYDGFVMQNKRQRTAALLAAPMASHDEIPEDVANFFEDLGMQLRYKYLRDEMVSDIFGYDVIHWWYAYKGYVYDERKRRGNDGALFSDFETLAEKMLLITAETRKEIIEKIAPDKNDVAEFLTEQQKLIP